MAMDVKEKMVRRAAEEIGNGNVVNLGVGLPQKVANYIPKDKIVFLHAENGILGVGPAAKENEKDPDLVDSGDVPITAIPGAAYFDSAESFALVRSGRLDITILGALQIAENGDLANWMIPGGSVPGMGGAMDLAKMAKRVIVLTMHTDKNGVSKLKQKCQFPLTADHCVSRIITDLGVIDITEDGFELVEIFEGHDVEEISQKTDASLKIRKNLKIISY